MIWMICLNNAPLISFPEKLLFAFNFAGCLTDVVISDLAATKFGFTVLKLSLNHWNYCPVQPLICCVYTSIVCCACHNLYPTVIYLICYTLVEGYVLFCIISCCAVYNVSIEFKIDYFLYQNCCFYVANATLSPCPGFTITKSEFGCIS